MKVLIIASWYPTPDQPINGVFFQQRARALARFGCEVSVAVADVRLRLRGKKSGISVSREDGVTEYRSLRRNLTPFWEEGVAKQQISMIRKIYERVCKDSGKPDIIHLESARCAYAAVSLAKRERIPLTYTEHYSGILNSEPQSFFDRTMRLAVDAADHIFLLSLAMKRRLAPPEYKSSYLPNAVNFSDFSVTEPIEPFTFVALGSLVKIKGFDLLLRAFAQVHKIHPNCILEIGGEGPEKDFLINLRNDLGLKNHVIFRGKIPLEKRKDFFQGKSAFICSSRTETFSIVTIEAFASGLPVIATKCGGPEDLVNDMNGYLVEKNSSSSLAEAMLKMIENRNSFDSEHIRQDAFSNYDEVGVVKKQIACFNRLLIL